MNADHLIRGLAESDSIPAITALLRASCAALAMSGLRFYASQPQGTFSSFAPDLATPSPVSGMV